MWGFIWLKELHIYFSNYPLSQGLRKRARASRWVSLHLIGWEGGARPITGRNKALPLVSRISLEYWLKFPLNKFSITQSLHVDHEVHNKRVYRQVLTLARARGNIWFAMNGIKENICSSVMDRLEKKLNVYVCICKLWAVLIEIKPSFKAQWSVRFLSRRSI